jgi:hypothetical protein
MGYVVIDLPLPPEGGQWCEACAMFLKARINEEHGEQIQKVMADGHDNLTIRPKIPGGALQPAAVRGICAELQNFGMLFVCWLHLGGVTVQRVSPLDPGGALPPGLLKGRG